MARKLQAMISLRSATATDQQVIALMTNVLPASTSTAARVPALLTVQIQRSLCHRMQVEVLYLSTSATPLVNDACVRFKRTFTTCRYAEVQQQLYVQQAAAPPLGRSGFIAVVRFYSIDKFMHREGTLQHRYYQQTCKDVVEASAAIAECLAKHVCVCGRD